MDKYEYRIRSEEIEKLVKEERYAEAAGIADTIDWRRVKNPAALLSIAELYKKNTRNEDCREILLLAYEKNPANRTAVFELCDVSIKLYDIVAAMGYFNQYRKLAPNDNGGIILHYRILEAQEASLEERIALLEDLKAKDYQEEWAYELAYLYHRIGLATRCAEECDQIVLWFGNGPYVMKAMELKMMHMPLTEKQQQKYDEMLYGAQEYSEEAFYADEADTDYASYEDVSYTGEGYAEDGSYIESNIESNIESYIEDADAYSGEGYVEYYGDEYYSGDNFYTEQAYDGSENPVLYEDDVNNSYAGAVSARQTYTDSDMSRFNTINIQKVVAEGMMEIFSDSDDIFAEERESFQDSDSQKEEVKAEEAPKPDTGGISKVIIPGENAREIKSDTGLDELRGITERSVNEEHMRMERNLENVYRGVELLNTEAAPEPAFKPMTGQMNINDVLSEWENIKLDNAKKHQEEIKKQIVSQTGKIFASFNDSLKDGILGELEKEAEDLKEEKEKLVAANGDEYDISYTAPGSNEQIIAHIEAAVAKELGVTRAISRDEIKRELAKPQIEEMISEENMASYETTVSEEAMASNEATSSDETGGTADELYADEQEYSEESYEESEEADSEESYEETYPEETYSEETYSEAAEESCSDEYYEEALYEEKRELDPEDEESIAEMAKEDALKTQEIKMNTADLTNLSDKIVETAQREAAGTGREEIRAFTAEEQKLFENFAVTKKIKKQIIYAVENITLAAFAGNVIITGERGIDTVRMAKNLIREFQETDANFSGKVAKITGEKLNQKILKDVFEKVDNGAIIIEKANGMTGEKLYELAALLNQDNIGIIVIMEDTKKEITRLLEKQAMIADYFNIRIDLMEMDNNALVAYARNYALALEYSIDEFGTLALYSRIANIQSGNHMVTKDEVREIIDEAIMKSKKSKVKNFVDVLFARRYDSEDMIVLKERDFM